MGWLVPPLTPKFEAALRDVSASHPDARVRAAQRLGRAEGEERRRAAEALKKLLGDAYPPVRATAVSAAASLKDPGLLEVLVAAFDDEAAEVRELAVIAVSEIGGARAAELLVQALKHKHPQVRFQAVAALFALEPERALAAAVPLLNDPDAEVRGQVLNALGELGRPHLSGHVAGLLEDEAPNVQLEAALALAKLGDQRGKVLLLAALQRGERLEEVASALATLGAREALEPLAARAQAFFTPGPLRAVLGAALCRLGDERGERALRRVLRGLRADAAGLAAELAAEQRRTGLIADLVWLSARPRRADRLTVIGALARFLPAPDARSALERLAVLPGEAGQAAREALSDPGLPARAPRAR